MPSASSSSPSPASFSHAVIAVPSRVALVATRAFYVAALGFTVVAETAGVGGGGVGGGADVWLQLFVGSEAAAALSAGAAPAATTSTLPPASSSLLAVPADGADAGGALTLRLTLAPGAPEAIPTSVDAPDSDGVEAIQKRIAEGAASAAPALQFAVKDLTALETTLTAQGRAFVKSVGSTWTPLSRSDIGAAGPTLHLLDPSGTLLTVVPAPRAKPSPSSSARPAAATGAAAAAAAANPAAMFKGKSADTLIPQLDAYLPMDHTPDQPAGAHKTTGKRIGVLTSGGDSSGMNAAVRAVARVSLQRGCVPFAIYEGYEGLVEGGDKIKKLGWHDVKGFLSIGGTVIGTARSMRFRTREGRLTAAENMVKNGIDALIVIGGDGSLTGADTLRAEWSGLVDELVSTGRLVEEECSHLRHHLTIVGLVGSIDNDMSSTDITIGAMSSLQRICESLDSLTSTAMSHQRAFVVEVMGRHCGWLGLMAAISVGADWVFLPERPPPLDTAKYGENWEDEMCEKLAMNRKHGSRKTLVIVAEGAIDRNLKPIKPDYIKTVIEHRLGLDTRVTTLGHVQRGGTPAAYDRYLATVQGVEAVEAVLRSTRDTPAPMIGMNQNKITAGPLMDAVKLTHEVAEAISRKDFARAMELRDPDFTAAYNAYIESHLMSAENAVKADTPLRIGIIHVGAPAGGMNAATRVAARVCLNRGHTPLGIRDGFSGLVRDEVFPLTWEQVKGWQVRGGSELGTNRDHPEPLNAADAASGNGGVKVKPKGITTWVPCGLIAYHLQKHGIQALLIVGGFEAFTSMAVLAAARSTFPAFCIPMVTLPATISNNVPGTDFSIGSDTALNAIVEACDRIKLSATASQMRVFVVEVHGGNCGYLAVLAGLAAGAMNVYIPEEGITLAQLQQDVQMLCSRFGREASASAQGKGQRSEGRVILRTESASADTYTTDVIARILRTEGGGLYDSRTAVLGHLQQGGVPSPLDRVRASRLAVNCVDWIQAACAEAGTAATAAAAAAVLPRVYTRRPDHACVIGIRGASVEFTPVDRLLADADVQKRTGKSAWWMGLRRLIKVLSKYYYSEEDGEEGLGSAAVALEHE